MRAGEHIRRVMEGTGVYSFTGGNPLDWEAAAYAAGFAVIEDAMEGLEKELFVATAPDERLGQWELLFRSQAGQGDLQARRAGMVQCLAAHAEPPTLESMKNMLTAAGIRGTVSMEEGTLKVTIESCHGVTQKEAKSLLNRYLPSHQNYTVT